MSYHNHVVEKNDPDEVSATVPHGGTEDQQVNESEREAGINDGRRILVLLATLN